MPRLRQWRARRDRTAAGSAPRLHRSPGSSSFAPRSAAPRSEAHEALTGGWLRFRDERPLDAAALVALCDSVVPGRVRGLGRPPGRAHLELTVHVRAPLPLPHDWVLGRYATRLAREGFLEEDAELFSRDGRLLAQSRQARARRVGRMPPMRVLYGVNGEGMGHATRSEVVIDALLGEHDVRVMASGAAFRYLKDRLGHVSEIFGPSFAMEQGEIRRWASVTHTIAALRRELPGSVRRWLAAVHEWRPDVVVTDFEPLSGIYARSAHVPLVCVDNIHMIDSCRHDEEILDGAREDFRIARAVTRAMVPTAGDYVITTFFRPPLLRGGPTWCRRSSGPRSSRRGRLRGDHLLVYSAAATR